MSGISNYAENKVLDHMLHVAQFDMPNGPYLALYTTDPTDLDCGQEVEGIGYARQHAQFTAADGGRALNSNRIAFPVALSNWGTVTHVGIRDAVTGGNLLLHAQLGESKVVVSGDQVVFDAGDLEVTVD